MNTLAKLYKQSLSLFYSDPIAKETERSLTELICAFAIYPYPVATVDIIQVTKVKEADKAFWHTLESSGLAVRFIPRRKDKFALVSLSYVLEPSPAETKLLPPVMVWQAAA
jgi:hypothetical protein